MLTRRKESDTYQPTVSRHRWSRQIKMKKFVKAKVLAENYNYLSIFIVICLLQRYLLTVAK